LNRRAVEARTAERERKKLVQNTLTQGGIVPPEMLILIPDPEKNLTPEELEALQASPDLLQAPLILQPTSDNATIIGDLSGLGAEDELQEVEICLGGGHGGHQLPWERESDELGVESDSDSSCASCDSIARNADFIILN